jgi:hypothetical protein
MGKAPCTERLFRFGKRDGAQSPARWIQVNRNACAGITLACQVWLFSSKVTTPKFPRVNDLPGSILEIAVVDGSQSLEGYEGGQRQRDHGTSGLGKV